MPIKMPKGACLIRKPRKMVFVEYSKGTKKEPKRVFSFPSRTDAAEHIYERIVFDDRIVPVHAWEEEDGNMGYLKVTVAVSTLGEVTVRITKP